ncbi:MAG: hypothetical protein Q9201_002333 [Fulgogasparrea decipioides]
MSTSIAERLEAFKQRDEERNTFIRDLVEANARLEDELRTTKSDHLDQLSSRRLWQEKAQSAEAKLKETHDVAAINSFVLCLIDGDGYLFDDSLLRQGAVGGSDAAHRLLDNIKRHAQAYDGAMQWKIIVRVYANIEGLLKKYAYIGFGEEEKALRQFVAGFTQSQPLFDFVDAGQGKERADHKVKEQLSLFISNIHCKHILLGVAHDNGYVPSLVPYKNNPTTEPQISLLRPIRIGQEYHPLPFPIIQFDSIFRTEELPSDRPSYANQAKAMSNFKQPVLSPTRQIRRPSKAKDLATQGPLYPCVVYLNRNDDRVDEFLGAPSEQAEVKLDSRIHVKKLCNDYHLLGDCYKPHCPYSHEPMLQGEELVAFAMIARRTACSAGSKCRSNICVLGHLCPNGPNCPRRSTCYFKKLHNVDPRIDHEYVEG